MQAHPRVHQSLEEAAAAFHKDPVKPVAEKGAPDEANSLLAHVGEVRERPVRARRHKGFADATSAGFPDVVSLLEGGGDAAAKLKVFDARPTGSIFSRLVKGDQPQEVAKKKERPRAADDGASDLGRTPTVEGRQKFTEMEGIDEENKRRLASMTRAEIDQARSELLSRFDPSLLYSLMDKRAEKKGNAESRADPKEEPTNENEDVTNDTASKDLGWIRTDDDLRRALKTHLSEAEREKVRWILEDEGEKQQNEECDDSLDDTRFDLDGAFVTPDMELLNELYHHGGPNVPGYTLSELVHLSRSTVAAQRVAALKALAGVLRRRKVGLSQYKKARLVQEEALIAIRLALDQDNVSALQHAVDALHAFLVPDAAYEESRRMATFLFGEPILYGVAPRAQGAPIIPPAPARELSMSAEQERKEDEDPESQLSDFDLAEASPVRFLVRSLFVKRAEYLLLERPHDLTDERKVKILEALQTIVRTRPHTVDEENCAASLTDIVATLVQGSPQVKPVLRATLELAATCLIASTSFAQKVVHVWLPAIRPLLDDPDAELECFAIMCLQVWERVGQSAAKFHLLFPIIAAHVDDALERCATGRSGEDSYDRVLILVAFDWARLYCSTVPLGRRKTVAKQLAGFAELGLRVAAELFGAIGTAAAASALACVAAIVGLSQKPMDIDDHEWQLGTLGCPSRYRGPNSMQWEGASADKSEDEDLSSMVESMLSGEGTEESVDSDANGDEGYQKYSNCTVSPSELLTVALIFGGHVTFEKSSDMPVVERIAKFRGLEAVLEAYLVLLDMDSDHIAEIIESSSVWQDLLSQSLFNVGRLKRPPGKAPLLPLEGVTLLKQDQVFALGTELLVKLQDHPWTLPWLNENVEMRMNKSVLIDLVISYVSNSYGSFGCPEVDRFVLLRLLGAILTPSALVDMDSQTICETRESLLNSFQNSLMLAQSSSSERFIIHRWEDAYKRWTRYSDAWMCIPLCEGPFPSREALLANLVLLSNVRGFSPNASLSAACILAVRAPLEVVLDHEVSLNALRWMSVCISTLGTTATTSDDALFRLTGGRERSIQLATSLVERYANEAFQSEFLGLCVCFLLSAWTPLEPRVACWKSLLRWGALRTLPERGQALFGENDWNDRSAPADEILDVLNMVVQEMGPDSCWIMEKVIVPRIRNLVNGPYQSKWGVRRLAERVQGRFS